LLIGPEIAEITSRAITLVPILSKFNSFKMARKGLLAMFEFSSLESATNNFSESNLLGVGGFGCVYKAKFEGGLLGAVKKLEGGNADCEKEFEVNENGIVCGFFFFWKKQNSK
jgi:hypothetical protein